MRMMNKIGMIACWFLAYAASSVMFMMKFGNLPGLGVSVEIITGFSLPLAIWVLRGEV